MLLFSCVGAAEGRSNGTPFKAVEEAGLLLGAKAEAEAIKTEAIASFMVN